MFSFIPFLDQYNSAAARIIGANFVHFVQISLSGHRPNFYGVEEMCVADNSNAGKLINVSDEMKQRVFHSVKDAFYKYNGMSGDNEAEWEEMARAEK